MLRGTGSFHRPWGEHSSSACPCRASRSPDRGPRLNLWLPIMNYCVMSPRETKRCLSLRWFRDLHGRSDFSLQPKGDAGSGSLVFTGLAQFTRMIKGNTDQHCGLLIPRDGFVLGTQQVVSREKKAWPLGIQDGQATLIRNIMSSRPHHQQIKSQLLGWEHDSVE